MTAYTVWLREGLSEKYQRQFTVVTSSQLETIGEKRTVSLTDGVTVNAETQEAAVQAYIKMSEGRWFTDFDAADFIALPPHPTGEVSLRQYIHFAKAEIDRFAEDWQRNQAKAPEHWPAMLTLGEWDDQTRAFFGA